MSWTDISVIGSRCEVSLFPAGLFEQPDQAEEFRERLLPWKEIECAHVLGVKEVLSVAGGLLLVTDVPAGATVLGKTIRTGRDRPEWLQP